MNRMIEKYLLCLVPYHQSDWDRLLASAEFANSSAESHDAGISPFELGHGWKPKTLLDLISGSKVSVQTLQDIKYRLRASLDDAKFSYIVAKSCQAAEATGRFKKPEYKVGSRLWINT